MSNSPSIKIIILATVLLSTQSSSCAHLDQAEDKAADLSPLISETLAISDKATRNTHNVSSSAAAATSPKENQGEWTFERVEYDLIDFLRDLGERYQKSSNLSLEVAAAAAAALAAEEAEAQLESKSSSEVQTTTSEQPTTRAPAISTSIDSEFSESSWQYGIFDRFTRPKSSSTTTTREPLVSADRLDVRDFNSDECGLRRYEEPEDESESRFYPTDEDADVDKRLRKPAGFLQRHDFGGSDDERPEGVGERRELGDPKQDDESVAMVDGAAAESALPSSSSTSDSEFNLTTRRQWLQQQLGNTLQWLGFNASSPGSPASFDTEHAPTNLSDASAGLDLKALAKTGKSLSKGEPLDQMAPDPSGKDLTSRQDEPKLEARVIGGNDARLGDSPWSVSLQALVARPGTVGIEYRHYCGGTIIAERYVLTAAHCLDFMVGRESRLFVVLGDVNWRMNIGSQHGRRIAVEKLIIHSGYKNTAFGHDVGLIKTKEPMRPVRVNGKYIVNSVCLPARNVEHSGEAELVGWGLFSNRNEMADSLQVADVPILPRPLCVDLYRRRTGLIQWLIGIELITDKQVCAGTFGRGICQGDSGSALVVNNKIARRGGVDQNIRRHKQRALAARPKYRNQQQSKATIVGVVAFGGIRRCSYQSLPGVYMQTSKYLDWILPKLEV